MKIVALESDKNEFGLPLTLLCHLIAGALWTCASYLASLYLSSHVCKMENMKPTSVQFGCSVVSDSL